MYYEATDFLETADSDTLKQIAQTRKLTREYYPELFTELPDGAQVLNCYVSP